jgi:6,7-dimethyl-8-ribityllumazine synthase
MSNTPLSLQDISNLQVPTSQVVIFYTEWNANIINELLKGCLKILKKFKQVKVQKYMVPGCVEIPAAIHQHYNICEDANLLPVHQIYIALGCVIKGDTAHFDYVCNSVTDGITSLNITLENAVIYGILTVNNHQQALDRIGGKAGHKGEEAAITALKMLALKAQMLNDYKIKN